MTRGLFTRITLTTRRTASLFDRFGQASWWLVLCALHTFQRTLSGRPKKLIVRVLIFSPTIGTGDSLLAESRH